MEPYVYEEMASLQVDHWWFCGKRFVLKGVLDKFFHRKDLEVLEVGCGPGGNFDLLKRYGQLTALEPNEHANKFLQQYPDVKIIKGGLPADQIMQGKKFDLVAALDVLEHIQDENLALAGLVDLVRPGGHLLLTVPAFQFMWSSHDVDHHHFRRYRKPYLLELLQKKKLEIRYSSYFNLILFPISMALRFLDKIKKGVAGTGSGQLPGVINIPLKLIFCFEGILLKFFRFPFGLSIVVLARKSE